MEYLFQDLQQSQKVLLAKLDGLKTVKMQESAEMVGWIH